MEDVFFGNLLILIFFWGSLHQGCSGLGGRVWFGPVWSKPGQAGPGQAGPGRAGSVRSYIRDVSVLILLIITACYSYSNDCDKK